MNARKILMLLTTSLLMTAVALSQTGHYCPSDAINDTLLNDDPVFSRSFMYMEHVLHQRQLQDEAERSDDLYVLPVVVHVIHTGEPYGTGTNITDEQIFSAIEAMNEDFRKVPGSNGDGDGVDVNIEFCLASRDPNGNPTNGIVRVNGSSVANYATMGIEASGGNGAIEESVKALSTWPRASYVNIWVVNEIENNDGGSGIQGYAYFPINNPIDGIVVLFNAFGTVGNLKSYTDMNRVITHEMGHYLGLYHTFNGTNNCNAESDCNTQGDRVCDTPVTIQSTSCNVPACSGTQQVENYMDYTSETCQNMFTAGQKLRMRTTLETQRTSMTSSLGCMPVFTNDIGITQIISPAGTNCQGALTPEIKLTNFGSVTLTSATITYNVDGTGNNTYNWTGSLAAGSSVTFTLNAITPSTGSHTFYAWTSSPNGAADQNIGNDQSTGTFAISTGSPLTLDVVVDYYGAETTWVITDENNFEIMNGGPYVNGQQGLHNYTSVCLADGCYTLTMNDAYGDGQGFTNGSYSLTESDGTVLASGGGDWGDFINNPFCVTNDAPSGNAPVASFTIQDNTLCKNVQNDYTSTSTNNPTSYSWVFEGGTPSTSTLQNPLNITYANAGTYDVTLTATNSFGSHTYTCNNCITVYNDPTVTLTPSNPLCSGQNNGSVATSVTGASPYTYAWNTGATSANLSNVGAGTYSVTVTDANTCTRQANTTLVSPTAMNVTGTVTNAACSGINNGSITANATGGTGNKTYSWNTGATGATISNLAAGNYTVTVLDANNCSATQSFTVTAPAGMSITGTTTQPTCLGLNNGSIVANATGGTGNKTYTWNTGVTGATLSAVAAGTYTVTVTDAAGCSQTQSFTLTAPAAMNVTGTTVNPTCAGSANGSITANATGGSGNKTYSWSNGANGATVNNLAAGSYTVTVSDASGCSQTQTFTLVAPNAMTITANTTQPTCGNNNGSIAVSVAGGTGNKTYSWNTGATTSTISNLSAGSYTVSITDANGCTQSQSFTLSSPAAFSVSGTVTAPTCFNSANGIISVNATGGSGNISYSWSNGSTGSIISNAVAGTYTVTATDANGCSDIESFTVAAPQQMALNPTVTHLTCFGNATGSIALNVTGGTGNKTYFWNTGAVTSSINNLNAGNYSVLVTDQNGCVASQNFTVTTPAALNANLNDFDIACNDEFGSAQVSPTGGSAPYNILWSNGSTGTSINALNEGTYSVQISDANGCSTSSNFEITASANLSVFANTTQISCANMNNGSISLNVNGGDQNYTYFWSNGSTASSISNLSPGNYSVVVTDGNGCNGSTNITISQPSPISVEIDAESVSCFGLSDGIATVSAAGGTSPYNFDWDNGNNGQYQDELAAGTYYVTISDANGCAVQAMVIIDEPEMLVANVVLINAESCAGNDGSAEVMIEGGSPGYFIIWNNGSTENILSGAASGMYEVTVTDAHGCLLNLSTEIPYDCEVTIPQTQLVDSDCNATDVALNAIITCDEVPGASMYQWRFSTSTGIVISDEYSLGNMFYVSQIPGLLENTTYVVGVKAMVNSNWSAFGAFCSITTVNVPDNDLPGLVAEDCGISILSWGQTITSVEVPGAINYQWHITGENYDWTTYTESNTLTIEENMQMIAGETYSVQMRCALGNGNFTDWGTSCDFSIALTIAIDDNDQIPGFLSIYPNPSDGERLYFDFGNLRNDLVVKDIMLFGPGGNLIESFTINVTSGTNKKHEHQFKSRLASGVYVLAYVLDGQQREIKLLVK